MKTSPFAAAGLASLALIATGLLMPPAIAQSPAKSSVVGDPAKSQVKARPSVDKGGALAPRSGVNVTALTAAECTQLGGQVRDVRQSAMCAGSKKYCLTRDANGKAHGVCISKAE